MLTLPLDVQYVRAMFIYEFTRPPGTPDDNIPFAPLVQDMGDAVGVGIEVNF